MHASNRTAISRESGAKPRVISNVGVAAAKRRKSGKASSIEVYRKKSGIISISESVMAWRKRKKMAKMKRKKA